MRFYNRDYFFVAGIPSCQICTEKQAPGAGWFFLLHLIDSAVMQGSAVHSPERWDQTHMPHPGKKQGLLPGWGWGSQAICELTAHFPFGYNTSFISIAAVPPGELKAQLSHHIELNSVYFLSIHFSKQSISCCSNISLTQTSCYYRLSKAPC